jgi:hypothetical protein
MSHKASDREVGFSHFGPRPPVVSHLFPLVPALHLAPMADFSAGAKLVVSFQFQHPPQGAFVGSGIDLSGR